MKRWRRFLVARLSNQSSFMLAEETGNCRDNRIYGLAVRDSEDFLNANLGTPTRANESDFRAKFTPSVRLSPAFSMRRLGRALALLIKGHAFDCVGSTPWWVIWRRG